jgi:uncharacterized protein with HEPN domain
MRRDDDRVADILAAAAAIHERFVRLTLAELHNRPDAVKATFYDVVVIGEAIRDLLGRRDAAGNAIEADAAIVVAHPDIPWSGWVGMRDMVTHQYFRAAPEIVWRDYQAGELDRLIACCRIWLESRHFGR